MILDNQTLYHYGVLGMKWGIRRYQPYPKGHKGGKEVGQAARSSSGKSNPISRLVQQRKERKEAEAKERIQKELENRRAAQERKAADKDRVLREGTAKEVLEYTNELSNKELLDALNRIKWSNELKTLSQKEATSLWNTVSSFMGKVGEMGKWLDSGTKFYNSVMKMLEEFDLKTDNKSGNK